MSVNNSSLVNPEKFVLCWAGTRKRNLDSTFVHSTTARPNCKHTSVLISGRCTTQRAQHRGSNDRRRGEQQEINYNQNFFQDRGVLKREKFKNEKTNYLLFCVLLRQCTPPPPVYLYSAACSLLPHNYFAVGEIKDGEAEGWLYPPPSSFICGVLLERV